MVHMVKNESYKIQKYDYEYGCSKHITYEWYIGANNEINVPIDKYGTCKCQTLYEYHILTSTKRYNEIEHIIETSCLIDLNGININQHKQMTNTFQNLHHNQYLSYNHHTTMINEYNNPNLIACMFPILFPFGNGVPKMNNKPIKLSLQTHVKHWMILGETCY
jgi:hypothetical protein